MKKQPRPTELSAPSVKVDEQYKVPGLEKGIAILEHLSDKPHGLTLQEIKGELDLSQSSAYRILNTLVRLGYVIFNDESKIYTLSKKMLTVGFRVLREHDLFEKVLPRLRELRDVVKESVFFGVLGDERGVFIEQAQGLHPFKFVVSPGSPFELYNSAGGKAILAWTNPHLADYYISKIEFVPLTAKTITREDDFRAELEQVRRQGYALDAEETLRGVVCVGAPIFGYDGYATGAIWVSGPADRMGNGTMRHITASLRNITDDISAQMGYVKPTSNLTPTTK